jgi:hypothetical protein
LGFVEEWPNHDSWGVRHAVDAQRIQYWIDQIRLDYLRKSTIVTFKVEMKRYGSSIRIDSEGHLNDSSVTNHIMRFI